MLKALIACLFMSGPVYQFVSTKIDESKYPPLGKMVDLGTYKMHINCTGNGGPTVVLDAGLGGNCLDWSLVQPEIAQFTRVCSYDRAGTGWSESSPLVRTSSNIVDELHTLLHNANMPAPYILVGHSFGGVNVQLYAQRYPDEVAGIVLVDSAHEDSFSKMPPAPTSQNTLVQFLSSKNFLLFLTYIGVPRLFLKTEQARNAIKMFSDDIQNMCLATVCTPRAVKAMLEENTHFEESLNQLKNANAGNYSTKPVVVIVAGKSEAEGNELPQEYQDYCNNVYNVNLGLQKEFVAKLSDGALVVAKDSNHMITRNQPSIIVEAVRELVDNIK